MNLLIFLICNMKHIIYEAVGSFETTCEEEKAVYVLHEYDLYNHLLDYGVNMMRPYSLEDKFIEPYRIGNIAVSMQMSYQLQCLREKLGWVRDDSCMSLAEFNQILGVHHTPSCISQNVIDVQVRCGKCVIIPATQMSLSRLIGELKWIVLHDKCYR